MIALLKDQLIMEIRDQNVEDVVDEIFVLETKMEPGKSIYLISAILEEEDLNDDGDLDWRRRATIACRGEIQKQRIVDIKRASNINDIVPVTDTGE